MRTDLLDYHLPEDRIATEPTPARDGARMLVMERSTGALHHDAVRNLVGRIPAGALMVVNDTRVIPARLHGVRPTGGRVELLLVRALDPGATRWSAMGRASKPLRPGTTVTVGHGLVVTVQDRDADGLLTVTLDTDDPWGALDRHGEVPLPPYMHRGPTEADRERYQTVFAATPGAVAAPTAGLHLTQAMLTALRDRGMAPVAVTLHVGPGTFAPVAVDDLDRHPMHAEHYVIPAATAQAITAARAEGRPVVAVGTTVVRTLESWHLDGDLAGETRLLIQPGYTFTVVDGLLTNFHLPRSTLLALVMAFAGIEAVRNAYAQAVAQRYRFFSYGDAMLIL